MTAFNRIAAAMELALKSPAVADDVYRGAHRPLGATVQSAVGVEFVVADPTPTVINGPVDWAVQIVVDCEVRSREVSGDVAVDVLIGRVYQRFTSGVMVGAVAVCLGLPVIESGSGVAGEKIGWAKLTYRFSCRTDANTLELAE